MQYEMCYVVTGATLAQDERDGTFKVNVVCGNRCYACIGCERWDVLTSLRYVVTGGVQNRMREIGVLMFWNIPWLDVDHEHRMCV